MSKTSASAMSRFRLVLWGLVLVSGIAATLYYFISPPTQNVSSFGGPFTLQSTAGETFTDQDLSGTPSLMFFGYTFCPDVCPTTLAESTGWRSELNLSEDDLRIIFVSVDPERDGLEELSQYLSAFGSPVLGLTGTEEEIEAAKRAFGVFSEKVDDPGAAEYLINHTASVFMVDGKGDFLGTISFGEAHDTAIAKIQRLLDA